MFIYSFCSRIYSLGKAWWGQLDSTGRLRLESLEVSLICMPASWARKAQTAGDWYSHAFLTSLFVVFLHDLSKMATLRKPDFIHVHSGVLVSMPGVHASFLSERKPWDFSDLVFSQTMSFLLHSFGRENYKSPTRLRGEITEFTY